MKDPLEVLKHSNRRRRRAEKGHIEGPLDLIVMLNREEKIRRATLKILNRRRREL